jgi:transposase
MNKRQVKSYAQGFKESSAKLAASTDQPIVKTAKDLGVNATTLYGWVKEYYPQGLSKKGQENDLAAEVIRLRKENARLKQERDILKKAAAYFANDLM